MKKGRRCEIWVTPDENGKERPYLIVSNDDEEMEKENDHTILKVTSQQPRNKYDVVIEEWEEAKLLKPSVVRCSKIRTIDSTELIFKVGSVTDGDMEKVLDALKKYFKM